METKFDNVITLKGRAVRGFPSSIDLMLTQEQFEVYRLLEDKEKENPLYYFGFVPSNQIISYHCSECGFFEQDKTLKTKVNIRDTVFDKPSATVRYYCEKDHLVFYYLTTKGLPSIPVDLISWDETGDYITPTPEAIEKIMERIGEDAQKGTPEGLERCIESEHDLKIARKWAEKIGYEISKERIDSLEEIRKKAYIEKFHEELPEFLNDIVEYHSHTFSLIEHDGFSFFEQSGIGEKLDVLFEMLPCLDIERFTDESKVDIVKILHLYNLMFVKKRDSLQGEKEELEKKIEEIQKEITGSKSYVIEYENKFGLTREQRIKAEKEANST